jgi:hypothetical protein
MYEYRFNGTGPSNYQRLAALFDGMFVGTDPDTFSFEDSAKRGVNSVTPLPPLASGAFAALGIMSTKYAASKLCVYAGYLQKAESHFWFLFYFIMNQESES